MKKEVVVEVSMPSRASTSLLQKYARRACIPQRGCQCPLGLVPHCYSNGCPCGSNIRQMCQCPLGLVPHCYKE